MWQETRCFDCLAELYGMLNEDDVLFGLWKRRGAAQETRAALSCIQHGMLVRGQDFLEEAINKNQAGAYQSPGELWGNVPCLAQTAACFSHVVHAMQAWAMRLCCAHTLVAFPSVRNMTSEDWVPLACVSRRAVLQMPPSSPARGRWRSGTSST